MRLAELIAAEIWARLVVCVRETDESDNGATVKIASGAVDPAPVVDVADDGET